MRIQCRSSQIFAVFQDVIDITAMSTGLAITLNIPNINVFSVFLERHGDPNILSMSTIVCWRGIPLYVHDRPLPTCVTVTNLDVLLQTVRVIGVGRFVGRNRPLASRLTRSLKVLGILWALTQLQNSKGRPFNEALNTQGFFDRNRALSRKRCPWLLGCHRQPINTCRFQWPWKPLKGRTRMVKFFRRITRMHGSALRCVRSHRYRLI